MKQKKYSVMTAATLMGLGLVACSSEPKRETPPPKPLAAANQPAPLAANPIPDKLGVVNSTPSQIQIPTQKIIVEKQSIPAVTEIRVGADINRLSVDDFKALGLTAEQGQAIVRYRDVHGPFKTVSDLANVPQINGDWVAENMDHLAVAPNPTNG